MLFVLNYTSQILVLSPVSEAIHQPVGDVDTGEVLVEADIRDLPHTRAATPDGDKQPEHHQGHHHAEGPDGIQPSGEAHQQDPQ